ncbi:MAG: hypothetical protein WC261_09090 [Synergistaceae bacterium]
MQTSEKQRKTLAEYDGDDKVISSFEMADRLSGQKHLFHVRSQIPTLDKLIDGFVPGELIMLSGRTKNGKTLLAQTLTNNFNNQDVLSLWFTYELPPRQFLDCFPSVPHTYMPALLKAGNWQWIEDRIMESFLKYHTRVVFIDHLHFVVDIARQQNMSLEIGTIIRRLKLLAVRENFILFVMAHTKKPSDSDHFGEIRDSSFAEQESDVTLMVRRFPDIGPSIACVRVNQSRRTGVMQEKVWLEKKGGFLVETCEREIPEEKPKTRRYWEDD